MKKLFSLCLMVLLFGSGCATHYIMTLDNGAQITTKGKPKLKNGIYHFKDIRGQDTTISMGRVTEIAPASMVKEKKAPFSPESK
jgi:hypothetical protein